MARRMMCARVCMMAAVIVLATATSAGAQTSDLGPASLPTKAGDPNLGIANQGTRTLNFDNGWRFKLVSTDGTTDPSNSYGNSPDPKAAAPSFPDSGWEHVTLPHDWSITQLPRPDQTNATGYFPGGLGWYRKTFTLPAWMNGKRISIDFDGVFDNSYVYLNGRLLGNHPYGYTGYSYDVSGLVHADGRTPNVLAVVVQNQEPSSRWYSGSGITRHVHLTVANPVHLARWGTFVTTPNLASTVRSGYADVHVTTQLASDGAHNSNVRIAYAVVDPAGRVVARSVANGAAPADLRVESPQLWSTTTPRLYTLRTTVTDRHRVVDHASTAFGIRWLTFDPNHGITLNGQPLKLHGVDLHKDEGGARIGRPCTSTSGATTTSRRW